MFESAELGHKIDKKTYDAEVPALREALLDAQFELAEQARFPVILLINGVDGAGKGDTGFCVGHSPPGTGKDRRTALPVTNPARAMHCRDTLFC